MSENSDNKNFNHKSETEDLNPGPKEHIDSEDSDIALDLAQLLEAAEIVQSIMDGNV